MRLKLYAGGRRMLTDSSEPTMSPTASPEGHGNGSTHDTEHLEPPEFHIIMTFLVISSILASILEGFVPRKVLRVLPQPVILMLIYVVAGAIAGKPFSVEIEAEMILTIFLPALLTNEALKIETTPFYKSLIGLMWLIGPALFLGAAIVAVYPYAFFPEAERFNWNLAMAFGGMIATTDPIAVSAMVSGESLLNDATSIICVTLFLGYNSGKTYTAADLVFFIFNQLLFSVLWGIGIGMATFAILRVMKVLDAHTLFALSIATPYLVFTIATYYFHDSGVLSLIPVGLFFNHFMSGVAGEEQVHAIREFWEALSFLATSWLYSLTGLLVGIELVSRDVTGEDWASLIGLYLWVVFARFVVVFSSLPVFIYAPGGYGFNFREAILLAWGGLRGAVGLLLALIIKGHPSVSPRNGQVVLFMMAGTVVLVQIQGVTFPFLLKKLKVVIKPNPRVQTTLRTKMSYRAFFVLTRAGVEPEQAREILRVHKEDKGNQDLPASTRFSTKRRQAIMAKDPDMMQHPLTGEYVSKSVLNDKRRRLLQAQRATYNSLLSRELISRTAWLLLMRGIDIQLDKEEISMNQWEFLLKSTPQACCNLIGVHTTEEKALMNALFGQELADYLRIREEMRRKQLMMSQRTRTKTRLGGVVRKVSFEADSEADANEANSNETTSKLNVFRRCYARWFADPTDEEIGAAIHKRDFGLDLQDAKTFGYMSWAFLIAQNHSAELIYDMFKLDESFIAFDTEQQALRAEIEQSRTQPALYLDVLLEHFPTIARKIKSSQAVAEIKSQVYGYVEELFSNGLIETHSMKKLMRDADRIVRVIKHLDFPLEPPYSVGPKGVDVLKCPNFHPFFQSDIFKQVSLDDFNVEDIDDLVHETMDEKEPFMEGFGVRKRKQEQDETQPLSSASAGDSFGGLKMTSSREESPDKESQTHQLDFADSEVDAMRKTISTASFGLPLAPEDQPVVGGFGVQLVAPAMKPSVKFLGSSNRDAGQIADDSDAADQSKPSSVEDMDLNNSTMTRPLRREISISKQGSIRLLRNISGGNAAEDEGVLPMGPTEYHEFLSTKPSRIFRQSSFHNN